MPSYLLEIGLEELPAQVILPAVQDLQKKATQTLEKEQIPFEQIQCFSTPRRLAILIHGLPEQQADQDLEIKGPPANIAKDEHGNWSKAALGFAKKNDVPVEQLTLKESQGREFLYAHKTVHGKAVPEVFQEHATSWVLQIPFPKNMRWGAYKTRYARPIRWLVSLWEDRTLPLELEMLHASNQTQGHRTLAPGWIQLSHATDYEAQLRACYVECDFERRQQTIISQVQELEQAHNLHIPLAPKLLTEVTNLVEWPTVFQGNFSEEFLEVPTEVLVTSMATHQRYFPVYDTTQKQLAAKFVGVRNGNAEHLDNVIHGNEKVLRARLSDARFFFQEDQKRDLSHFIQKSQSVVFFQGRGTLAHRTERLQELTKAFAEHIQMDDSSTQKALRIASLCKFDLQTQMVYEFPELQGVMGHYYAQLQSEDAEVAQGIEEHYYPLNAQGALPENLSGVVVAVADKIDLMTTAFSLGKIPSGSADPYALRRAAQGVVQLLVSKKLSLSWETLAKIAVSTLINQQNLSLDPKQLQTELIQFLQQRQKFLMQEAQIRYDVVDAISGHSQLLPFEQMELAQALTPHLEQTAFKTTTEAIVRSINICQKQSVTPATNIHENALNEASEQALWAVVQQLSTQSSELPRFFENLFALEAPITQFFDQVLVMDADPVKQQNRLALCQRVSEWSLHYLNLRHIIFPGDER